MNFPRQARIVHSTYCQRSDVLAGMGLPKQVFNVVDQSEDGKQVFVDPADLVNPKQIPFPLRRDIVEFIEES